MNQAFSTQPRVETAGTHVVTEITGEIVNLSVLNHESKRLEPGPSSTVTHVAPLSVLNHESKRLEQCCRLCSSGDLVRLSVLNHESKRLELSPHRARVERVSTFSTQPRVETAGTYAAARCISSVSAFSTQPRVETAGTRMAEPMQQLSAPFSTQPRVETAGTGGLRRAEIVSLDPFSTQPRVETAGTPTGLNRFSSISSLSVLNHESKRLEPMTL